jgi:heme iron utilization protein
MDTEQPESNLGNATTLERMLASFDGLPFAVLATSDNGRPYTSLVAFALTPDRRTLIFGTPRATNKYRNLVAQPAVSVLIDNRSQTVADLRDARAVTLLGSARELQGAAVESAEFRRVFKEKHPELRGFIDAPETVFFAVTIEQAVHVARFEDVSYWP